MANTGVGTGIGEGLGIAFQNIAQEINTIGDRNRAEKQAQAEALHQKGTQLLANAAQAGYQIKRIANPYDTNATYPDWLQKGFEVLDSSGNPVDPASVPPQVQNWIGEAFKSSQDLQKLYPPHESNALIQHFRQWLGKQQAPATPNPLAAQNTPEALQAGVTPPPNPLAGIRDRVAQIKALHPGMTDQEAFAQVAEEEDIKSGRQARAVNRPNLKPYRLPDGTVQYFDASDPANIPPGATAIVAAAQGPKPGTLGYYISSKYPGGATPEQQSQAKSEWESKLPKVGSEEDFMRSEYGANPTPEQKLEAHRLWTGQGADTVGTHVIEVPQPDGTIKAYQVTTTSHKELPGAAQPGAPAAKAPVKTSGEGKSRIQELGVTGGRETPAQTDADKKYGDAVKLASLADNAMSNPSATNDKLLAGALIRGTEGRFNAAQYDNLTKKAGLANTFNQWLESASTGQLTPEIRKQLVDAAKANLEAAKKQREASRQSPSTTSPAAAPSGGGSDPLGILGKKP